MHLPSARHMLAAASLSAFVLLSTASGSASPLGGLDVDEMVPTPQLQAAVRLGELALQRLNAPYTSMSLGDTREIIYEMYARVRTAIAAMEIAKSDAAFPDPLLDFELSRTHQAWDQIRAAVDPPDDMTQEAYISAAIYDVHRAVAILEEVLLGMP